MKKTPTLLLSFALAALLAGPATAQQASNGTAAPAALTQQSDDGDPSAAPAPPQQGEQQGQAREFILVEGDLPYIPSSNSIAAKLPLSLLLTPFNVGTVTEALFDEQYDVTVAGALKNISNVNLQAGNGVNDFFLIRGFDSLSSALVMTDGASEPETTFYELYNVESVEVLKGPSGFLYGANPLAGTVNLVRKQPIPATLGSARVNVGRFDWVETAGDFNYGNADGSLFARVNAVFRDANGYRDRIEGRTFAINPAATWQIDDSASINFNFEYVSADYFPDSGIPLVFGEVPDVPRTNNYQSGLDDSAQDIYRFQSDYQNRLNDTVTLRNKFYYRGLDWDSTGTLFNGVIPVLTGQFAPTPTGEFLVSRSLVVLNDRQQWVGNQLEAVVIADTGSIRHSLVAGFELARQGDSFALDVGLLPDVPLSDPGTPTPGPPVLLPQFGQAGDARAIVAAPYIVDQIALHPRFQVLAGVRVDAIDFKDALSGVSRNDTNASPMVGGVFAVTDDSSLYANWSQSFAPPAPRVQTGNVAPEEGEEIEAGFKQEFLDRRARATFAVYQLERTNIGIPDANGITQQIGSQRSRGFETELIAEPRNGLRFAGSYAYNVGVLTEFTEQVIIGVDGFFQPIYGTVDRSGNAPAFAPRHIFNAWVSQDIARALVVGAGARYVSDQYISEANDVVLDGVFTIDAMASYAFRDLMLSLNVRNLTNREYDLRGFGDNSITPADPITLYFGVSYRR
ncbi:MAG: TonB-dependent receptor [Acidobacteriota bacterium]|jgi:catecholate siderophore receptor